MAKSRDSDAPETRVLALEFRTPIGKTSLSIIGITFVAWIVSFFLFGFGTELGRAQVRVSGLGNVFFSWLLIAMLVCAGYGLGYLLLRRLAQGQRAYREREVIRLVLAESLATTCGGYAIGFFPMTLMQNMFAMLVWSFAIGFLFTFVILMPRYSAAWKRAVAEGRRYSG